MCHFDRLTETTLRSYTLFFSRETNYNNRCSFKNHFKGLSAIELLTSGDSYHKVCDKGFAQNRCIEQANIKYVKGDETKNFVKSVLVLKPCRERQDIPKQYVLT